MEEVKRLTRLVETENACALPGCTIVFDRFIPILRRAMSRGYVKDHHGKYVEDGLRYGFTLGADRGALKGKRKFRNYPTAYSNHASVNAAISSRVAAQKTICVGAWDTVKVAFESLFPDYFIFPMGAVPKPHQPDVYRPTSDHTRTGFNAATVLGILSHTLDAFNQVCFLLRQNYFMYVSDVEDAFTIIPLAPWLWAFMAFLWPNDPVSSVEYLHIHLFADFGTRGMPGTFKLFLVDVVVQMARSEFVITLPIVIYVDDSALIAASEAHVNQEMSDLQTFTSFYCGVSWKWLKDKPGARTNVYIGFVWHSPTLSISLEERKLASYLTTLAEAGGSRTLTLRDRQSLAGKMQRGIKTLPPGASCLLANCYALMSGLVLPWQQRRTTRAERRDYWVVHDLLELNMGRGWYSYDLFPWGPCHWSDASKSHRYTGGGYLGEDGFFDSFRYSGSAARKPIDYLEGDATRRCCSERAHTWRHRQIPFGIDNTSFEMSAVKGRSRAERLNEILICLFALQIRYEFILRPFWIPTDVNVAADTLSRPDALEKFLSLDLHALGFLPAGVQAHAHPDAGRTVNFADDSAGTSLHALRRMVADLRASLPEECGLGTAASNPTGNSASHAMRRGDAQALSLQFAQTSVYDGLLPGFHERFDEIMDSRLAPSSMNTVMVSYRKWAAFAEEHDFDPLIRSGDPLAGGRMASWVMSMVDDTELVYHSIATYVWGMREWQLLQHQRDPILGCHHWREFMQAVCVLCCCVSEPRRPIPQAVIRDVMENLDFDSFEDVNFGLIMLTLYFTFSRTECPCPKNFTGPQSFDPAAHWQGRDFRLDKDSSGLWVLWVRFKAYKQDPRVERPEAQAMGDYLPFDARGDGSQYGHDWVPIGDVPDDPAFSVSRWYMQFIRLLSCSKEERTEQSMFRARDKVRPYTYEALRVDLKSRLVALGIDDTYTPHGIRVEAYNNSKRANGEAITVAHGGWKSSAHARYERFNIQDVLSIPAHMLGQRSKFGTTVRPLSRHRTARGGLANDDGSDDGEPPVEPGPRGSDPPPGFERVEHHTAAGRTYYTYSAPDGRVFRSLTTAWAYHASQDAASPHASQEASSPLSWGSSPGLPGSPRADLRNVSDRPDRHRPVSRQTRSVSAQAAGATASFTSVFFPDDLSQHVIYDDRPSSRKAPAVRHP